MPTAITKDNYQAQILSSDRPVLLDFWAPWCGPCQAVAPLLEEIDRERPDVKVCKINVDEEMELARQFRVMSIPTLVVMKDGQPVHRAVGSLSKTQILALLD